MCAGLGRRKAVLDGQRSGDTNANRLVAIRFQPMLSVEGSAALFRTSARRETKRMTKREREGEKICCND